jgi:hypothetical protein
VSSKTTFDAYATLQVSEIWIYEDGRLRINLLQAGAYQDVITSPTFLDLPMGEMAPRLVEQAFRKGTRVMLRQFRAELHSYYSSSMIDSEKGDRS